MAGKYPLRPGGNGTRKIAEKLAFQKQHPIRFLARHANRRVWFRTVFRSCPIIRKTMNLSGRNSLYFSVPFAGRGAILSQSLERTSSGCSRRSETGRGQDA
jgi:hypothetical protein